MLELFQNPLLVTPIRLHTTTMTARCKNMPVSHLVQPSADKATPMDGVARCC